MTIVHASDAPLPTVRISIHGQLDERMLALLTAIGQSATPTYQKALLLDIQTTPAPEPEAAPAPKPTKPAKAKTPKAPKVEVEREVVAPPAAEAEAPAAAPAGAEPVDIATLKALLDQAIAAGAIEAVRALLKEFGIPKLSAAPLEKRSELAKRLLALSEMGK